MMGHYNTCVVGIESNSNLLISKIHIALIQTDFSRSVSLRGTLRRRKGK
jgi:hypothetical protein